jgi:outer membrane protein
MSVDRYKKTNQKQSLSLFKKQALGTVVSLGLFMSAPFLSAGISADGHAGGHKGQHHAAAEKAVPSGEKKSESAEKSIESLCKELSHLPAYHKEMSLEKALVLGYERNPTLRAARAQLRVADEGVELARGGYYPNIAFQANLNTTGSAEGTLGPGGFESGNLSEIFTELFDEFNDGNLTLTISQNLFNGFRTVNAVEAAKYQVCAARAELHNIEQQIMKATIDAYLDVLLNQSILELQENNIQVLERQLEATNARFAVGEITRTDVAQASAALAQAQAERAQAKGNLEAAKSVFESVVGHPAGYLIDPELDIELDPTMNGEAAKCIAVANNPQMEAARCQYYVRKTQVDIQCGDLYPELTLNAQAQVPFRDFELNPPRLNADDTNFARSVVSVTLNVPLYRNDGNAGTTYSKIREAKENAAVSYAQYEEAMRRVEDAAMRAYQDMVSRKSQIESFEIRVESEEIALDGVREEANVGTRTILDVLEAEQRYLNAKVQLEQAKSNYYKAKYQLDAALGHLTIHDLDVPVDTYDYQKHYDSVQWNFYEGCDDCDTDSYHNHREEQGFYENYKSDADTVAGDVE